MWRIGLSFGSNFGNLRAIRSNRVLRSFLVYTFKIKKPESILSNESWGLEKSLRISFGYYFVNLRANPSESFSNNKFCGRTDGHCLNRLVFSSWSRKCIHVHTYQDYFTYFTPLYPKLVYHFSIFGNRYKEYYRAWNRQMLKIVP